MKITRQKTVYYEEEVPDTIEEFTKWKFSSGSTTGKDFNLFAKMFKRWLNKQLPATLKIVNFNKGHYFLSGFVTNGSNYVYFSLSDVRHFSNWSTNILIRTTKNDHDYTGGSNNSTTLSNLSVDVQRLLN